MYLLCKGLPIENEWHTSKTRVESLLGKEYDNDLSILKDHLVAKR